MGVSPPYRQEAHFPASDREGLSKLLVGILQKGPIWTSGAGVG